MWNSLGDPTRNTLVNIKCSLGTPEGHFVPYGIYADHSINSGFIIISITINEFHRDASLTKTSGPLCITCFTIVNGTVAGGVRCRMIYRTVPSSVHAWMPPVTTVIGGGSIWKVGGPNSLSLILFRPLLFPSFAFPPSLTPLSLFPSSFTLLSLDEGP